MNQNRRDQGERRQDDVLDDLLSQIGAQPVPVNTDSVRREAMRQIRREALLLKRPPSSWRSVVAAAAAVVLGFGFWWLFRSAGPTHQPQVAVVQPDVQSAPGTVVVVNMPQQSDVQALAPREGDPMIIVAIGPARAETAEDELIVHDCDLDACAFLKETTFKFEAHRRIEHYQLICSQTGAVPPPE